MGGRGESCPTSPSLFSLFAHDSCLSVLILSSKAFIVFTAKIQITLIQLSLAKVGVINHRRWGILERSEQIHIVWINSLQRVQQIKAEIDT